MRYPATITQLVFGPILVLVLATVVVAQDAPRSGAALRAISRHDQAMRKAEQEYQRAAVAAKRDLIADLEQVKAQAMSANQLSEANAIEAAIDAAKEDLDRLMGKPQVHTFRIEARKGWQPTVEVQAGQRVDIKAVGKWDAATNRNGQYALDVYGQFGDNWYGPIAKLGSQEVKIPKRVRFTAEETGMLQIQLYGGGVDNDAGSVQVTISIYP